MPRIKRTAETPSAREAYAASREAGETNDCTIRALTILTGLPYNIVRDAINAEGRKPRNGTFLRQKERALNNLGFDLVRVPTSELQAIIAQYPGCHKNCKSITSHHPRRFAKVWDNQPPMLMTFHRHDAAFKDGKVHDWSVNKALRLRLAHRVVKRKEA